MTPDIVSMVCQGLIFAAQITLIAFVICRGRPSWIDLKLEGTCADLGEKVCELCDAPALDDGDEFGCKNDDERLRLEILKLKPNAFFHDHEEAFRWIKDFDRDDQRARVITLVAQAAMSLVPAFIPRDDDDRDSNVAVFSAAMGDTVINAFEKVWPEARSLPGVQNLIPLAF